MPRNSRALLPAKIRTRLEPNARAGRYSHGIFISSDTTHLLRVPVARRSPRAAS
jgi:hypothetical protein